MLLLFIFVLLINLIAASVDGQYVCGLGENYTSDSTYKANLNTLLSSLSRNLDHNGFYNVSMGTSPNRVNALVLCMNDLQLDMCRSCVQNATNDLVSVCPNQRQAIYWGMSCMLRYSSQPLSGTLEISPGFNDWIQTNVSNIGQFNVDLRILLNTLRGQASLGGSLRKVAAGHTSTSDSQTIYALVQCTPDLAPTQCTSCLIVAAQQQNICCSSFTGARILMPSCNLRYDVQLFFNESRLLELIGLTPQSQSPTPAPGSILPEKYITYTRSTPGKGVSKAETALIAIVFFLVAGTIFLVCNCCLSITEKRLQPSIVSDTTEETGLVESLQYEFDKLSVATDGFSEDNKLGQGAFGAVYWGKLQNGLEVAVKRLSISGNPGEGGIEFKNGQFMNEVKLLVNLRHRNLVRLLGFSIEGIEKLLVYEFHQKLSLDRFIFGPNRYLQLDWDKCYKIIMGIAKGLLYLHEDTRLPIIHRDLKADNILLDDEMNPKIADFGTARLFALGETRANTYQIVGTRGYMAPEYAMDGEFSVKSDVFSFGVIVLEIISGHRTTSFEGVNGVESLTNAAWRMWRTGEPSNLIGHVSSGSSDIPDDILRYIHIGLLCIQPNRDHRPTMASVILMLNGFPSILPEPKETPALVTRDYDIENSSGTGDNCRIRTSTG